MALRVNCETSRIYLHTPDGIHLSRYGTAVLHVASNMKKTIDTVCKTPHRGNEQGIRYRKNGYRNRTAGNYRGHYGNNRSSYGQSENYNRHQMNVYERRGPYQRTGQRNKRTCLLCNQNCVEDESHFLTECLLYKEERNSFFHYVSILNKNFTLLINYVYMYTYH